MAIVSAVKANQMLITRLAVIYALAVLRDTLQIVVLVPLTPTPLPLRVHLTTTID